MFPKKTEPYKISQALLVAKERKKDLCTILFLIAQITLLIGQKVEVSPKNPSPDDCIYIFTETTTTSLANISGFDLSESEHNIRIEACFRQGPANAIGVYYDTIALGQREEGLYHLNYLVSLAKHDGACEEATLLTTHLSFEVSSTSSSETNCNELEARIFPNPVVDNDFFEIKASETITQLEIFDYTGKLIYKKSYGRNRYFNFAYELFSTPGIYFIRINGVSPNSVTLKLLKL